MSVWMQVVRSEVCSNVNRLVIQTFCLFEGQYVRMLLYNFMYSRSNVGPNGNQLFAAGFNC